ncbi:hypothetical protein ACFL2Q_14660 [Thermodesulfobacteriota bacterium]
MSRNTLFLWILAFAVVCLFLQAAPAMAASSSQLPDGFAPAAAPALNMRPSNPLGMPGSGMGLPSGSNSLSITPGCFKELLPIPSNLELGYYYTFGNKWVSAGRATVDFLAPISFENSAVFGEFHGEWTGFKYMLTSIRNLGDVVQGRRSFAERTDLSLGGGFRRMLG